MRCPEACQMAQTPTSGFVQSSGQDYLFHGMKRTLESFKNPGLLAPCFQTNPKIWVCLKTRYPAYRNRTGQFDGLSKFSPVKLSALGIQHTPFLSMFGHSRV